MSGFDRAWNQAQRPGKREPDTPDSAEGRLQRLYDDLETNEDALVAAYDGELAAQEDLDSADVQWRLDESCPQAGTYDGVRVTVAYVNAWVKDKCAAQRASLRAAVQLRKAAEAQRRRLENQLRGAQPINKSVTETYRGTNSRGYGS